MKRGDPTRFPTRSVARSKDARSRAREAVLASALVHPISDKTLDS